jgi:hypothetical protein
MNTTASTMGDDDIRAFSAPEPPLAPLAPLPAPRRRWWPWLLLGAAVLGLLLMLSLGSMIWHEVQGPHGLAGLERWQFGIDEDGFHGDVGLGGVIVAVSAVVVALLIVAVIVPLVLLGVGLAVGMALGLAALSIVVVIALALGAAAVVLLVVSSPLWLIALAFWWALKKPSAVASPAPN